MEELYIDVSTNLLYDIRLRIEGAVQVYETEAKGLSVLAEKNDMPDASCAMDTIASALYDLRSDIQKLHSAHQGVHQTSKRVKSNTCQTLQPQ